MAACSYGLHLPPVLLLLACVRLSVPKAPCDPLISGYCLLPFPSSYYLQPNVSTKTGYSVHFPIESFPRDSFGRRVNPDHWNTFGETATMKLIHCHVQCITNHPTTHLLVISSVWASLFHLQMGSLLFHPSWPTLLTCHQVTFPTIGTFQSLSLPHLPPSCSTQTQVCSKLYAQEEA